MNRLDHAVLLRVRLCGAIAATLVVIGANVLLMQL
jgi:hypothetical protein